MITLPTIIIFLVSIAFHEYAHAWTAVRLGDPTPRQDGRLTLNVLSHISLPGLLMLLIAGIGWAKPVRVNPYNLKRPEMDMLKISLAGPAANLLLAVICAAAWRLDVGHSSGLMVQLFMSGAYLNVMLAFFNLLPLPPLDGSKIISPFIPTRWNRYLQQIEPWGFLILLLLFEFGGLGSVLGGLTNRVIDVLLF